MIFQTTQEYLSSKEFLSALMGGCFTLFGVLIAYFIQTRKEDKSEKNRTIRQLKLLSSEIQILFKIVDSELAEEIQEYKPDGVFWFHLPIGENVFVFFDSSPDCLTQIPSETTASILKWYTRAKGFVALIKINNKNVEDAFLYAKNRMDEANSSKSPYVYPMSKTSHAKVWLDLLESYSKQNLMQERAQSIVDMYHEMSEFTKLVTQQIENEIINLGRSRMKKIAFKILKRG